MKRTSRSKPQSKATLALELIVLALGLWLFWRVQPPGTIAPNISQAADRTILYAAKSGTQVKVYQKDIKKGTQSELLNYANGSDGNVHVALAQDKRLLAYVSADGLQTYDLSSKKHRTLMKKQTPVKADGSEPPTWSVPELNNGVSYLGDLAISTNGKYICFVKGYAQALNLGLLEVANSHYIDLSKAAGFLAWSPAATQFVLASSTGSDSGLLQISGSNQLTSLADIKSKLGATDRFFAEAQFSQSGKRLAASYRDASVSGLITFKPDGTDSNTVATAERIFAPIYTKSDDLLFVQTQGTKATLMKQAQPRTKVLQLATLSDGFDQWYNPVPGQSRAVSLSAIGKDSSGANTSKFFVFNTLTGETIYQSQPQEVFIDFK